ncbi:geranylgeranyl reductase family protein [Halosegnis longus]|uniref:Geranylgeranyl reductase family protein n=1 Tax=Halosegnis longus TaxID=2216012 RepID=A0AAJ4R993_9EURY|nr:MULTISPECIES: geranylgeranyl reductase family protein [Halobacteriales]RNJ26575.1 geranylgeranyl reductase family protein [Salella cibi]
MSTHTADVAIVGAGTSGCYAATTLARAGYDTVIVERKDEQEAGHIACGDALKGANKFPEAIPKSALEPAFTNTDVDHGRFEAPSQGVELDIPVPGELAVIDRYKYGRILLETAADAGVEFHYDTVVQDVTQEDGRVTGFTGRRKGEPITYEAEMVIDGAGALSILQDKADFSEATFDTNVRYSQFSSAYREVLEVEEPVEWDDALVLKPTKRSAGYLWYFPRTPTEINVGLGFQMSEEPMKLVQDLREDISKRPEFEGAEVKDKLGAALPTRRTYDSATAPGYIAAGDSAAHVNPISGGGIAGAAYAGKYAAEQAMHAIEHDAVGDEDELWEYNTKVMDHFGARYAALDVYNIFAMANGIDDLTALAGVIPGEQIANALYSGSSGMSIPLAIKTAWKARGHLDTVYDLYQTKGLADRLLDHYESYPDSPAGIASWRAERDAIMDDVYAKTGAEAKY